MADVFRFKLVNVLSLDIVAGSIVSALFFSRLFDVNVLPYGLAALGLTVWLIYTTDHLLDARSITGEASTLRHWFHQKYSTPLMICVAIGLLVDAVLVFYIRPPVFKWGVILSLTVAAYLVVQRYLKFLKEIVIATLYTCGVLLPSITVTNLIPEVVHWIIIFQFAMLALTNLLIFSWFDNELDWKHNQHSFVTFFGKEVTAWIIGLLIGANLVIGAITFASDAPAKIILILMNVCLMMVFLFRERLKQDDRYRLIGDSIFLFPLLYFL
jgi:4-hydroxybenzoate polyprenyltransferase